MSGLLAFSERQGVVAPGRRVTIDVEIRPGGDPVGPECEKTRVSYTHGSGEIPETLESLLEGLREGAKLKVKLVPGQGYSCFDRPVLLAMEKNRLPREALRVGCELHGETPAGREVRFRVHDVRHRDVVLQSHDLLPAASVLDVAIEKVAPLE